MTVTQWTKAPGIHCYVVGSILPSHPDTIQRKQKKALWSTKKTKEKKVTLQMMSNSRRSSPVINARLPIDQAGGSYCSDRRKFGKLASIIE
jgi:hypothetical protein